jgi:hypothetical protein
MYHFTVHDEAEQLMLSFECSFHDLTVRVIKDTQLYPAANAIVFAARAISAIDDAMTMQHETIQEVFEQPVTFTAE